MDTALIAVITGLIQVAATLIVVKIQKTQIDGLRASINDQNASIQALKSQADGQVSLTNQQKALTEETSKLLANTKQALVDQLNAAKDTYELKVQAISQENEQTKALLAKQQDIQLENVAALDIQPEMTELLNSMIRETTSTKTEISQIVSLLESFIKTQSMIGAIRPIALQPNTLIYSASLSQEPHYLASLELKELEITAIIIDFLNSHHIRQEEQIDPSMFGLGIALIEVCKKAAPELANENPAYFTSALLKMAKSLIGPLRLMRENALRK